MAHFRDRPNKRKFGGEYYKFDSEHKSYAEAVRRLYWLRGHGYYARMTIVRGNHEIWARKVRR